MVFHLEGCDRSRKILLHIVTSKLLFCLLVVKYRTFPLLVISTANFIYLHYYTIIISRIKNPDRAGQDIYFALKDVIWCIQLGVFTYVMLRDKQQKCDSTQPTWCPWYGARSRRSALEALLQGFHGSFCCTHSAKAQAKCQATSKWCFLNNIRSSAVKL